MEFLFVNQSASIEAMIVFACMLVVLGIFGYDGFVYLKRVLLVFFPKRSALTSGDQQQEGTLALSQVSPFVESSDEKITENNTIDYTSIDGVVLDNPVLYPLDQSAENIEVETISTSLFSEDGVSDTASETTPIEDDTKYIGESPSGENIISISDSNTPPALSKENDSSEDKEISLKKDKERSESLEGHKETGQEEVEKKKHNSHRKTRYEEENSHLDHPKLHKKSHIKPEKKEKLVEILNNIRTLIARGQIDDARALIVSGLSIDKDNRELNLLMASLYERDHAFAKAEFILKDIALENPDDIEVLTHLATDLAMQRKYEVSYEIYKKILSLGGESEETLYTLIHLASEMSLYEDIILYARSYLKQYPHNPEILWLYSQGLITGGHRREAVETLIKLKNLTPYNQEIADLIQKLVTEEELAGNFGGEK